ncbi:MAG: exonuclease domain-containing protein [Gammaproteobacteria bacterium]|tara:strand:- start:317 stop:910 length:594 start_codon:yes stop_codon:yes gene_type:complete
MLLNQRFRKYLPVVVDLETGGFDPINNAILEIAVTLIGQNDKYELVVLDTHRYHIDPYKDLIVEQESLDFTKIKLDHPLRKAVSEKEALTELFKIINKAKSEYSCSRAILVGHNAHFDLAFIKESIKRNNIKKSPFHPFSVLDTVSLGAMHTQQTVLARVCESLSIDYDSNEAHSAAYDAEITAKVFCKIINLFDNK